MKYQNIVEFSEIGKFIDAPVKHYSTGMYLRLAFAVAAHLDSEIMLVDELLAVGDIFFQEKCLQKTQKLIQQGRTVIMVSHNLSLIQKFCRKGLLLRNGRVVCSGSIETVCEEYLESLGNPQTAGLPSFERPAHFKPVIQKVEFLDKENHVVGTVPMRDPVTVQIHYTHEKEIPEASFRVIFMTADGIRVFRVETSPQHNPLGLAPSKGIAQCRIPRLMLTPGTYFIYVACSDGQEILDSLEKAAQLEVCEKDRKPRPYFRNRGLVVMDAEWSLVKP